MATESLYSIIIQLHYIVDLNYTLYIFLKGNIWMIKYWIYFNFLTMLNSHFNPNRTSRKPLVCHLWSKSSWNLGGRMRGWSGAHTCSTCRIAPCHLLLRLQGSSLMTQLVQELGRSGWQSGPANGVAEPSAKQKCNVLCSASVRNFKTLTAEL